MLKTILVDDEFNSLQRLKGIAAKEKRLDIVDTFQKPEKFLQFMDKHNQEIDIVFLDIQMPGIKGLELAEKIQHLNQDIEIIFVTAYDYYAVEAFELNALDYLLKPVSPKRFEKTLKRLFKNNEVEQKDKEILKVNTMGSVEIYDSSGKKIRPDWATAKTEELFLFLLRYEGNYVSKGKIIENLWQDRPADRAKDILYTTIYNLRRTFKKFGYSDLIKGKRGYYKLNKTILESDILKQKELIRDYNSDQITEADFLAQMEELYRGEFLTDKNYSWSYAYQAEILKNYKNIVKKITQKHLEAENYEKAKFLLKKLTKLDPLDEKNHKKLIELYKKEGNLCAAERHYRWLKNILADEFDITPSFEL
jgi:two-component SAPR family response regulator